MMARNPIVIYSEREVKVNEQIYKSVQVGQSGAYVLKNKIRDVDLPVN